MGKVPYSNNLNTNPKSHSIAKKKHYVGVENHHGEDSPVVTQTSDDAQSFSQRPLDSNGQADFNCGGYISYNISSSTRMELIELKRQFISELEQIRSLKGRLDAGDFHPRHQGHQLVAKEKKGSGKKRPIPFVSEKHPARTSEVVTAFRLDAKEMEDLMKVCRQYLTKLMKHKCSWVFKQPVDAAALGLHDYHQIVKHPMDLGTVKSKFAKNSYKTPLEFAADVRLTFNNAVLYNPRTDDVHRWAVELLDRFEELFRPVEQRLVGYRTELPQLQPQPQPQALPLPSNNDLQLGSWNHIPTPEIDRTKKPKSNLVPPTKKNELVELPMIAVSKSSPPRRSVAEEMATTTAGVMPALMRSNMGKHPKPKARDPMKREMSMEEKQKLGNGLQSLPQEKMPQLIQIIKKRNQNLPQDGDEIELDFGALDTETLWELDRFVTNWKKMESKTKRQVLIGNNSSNPAAGAPMAATATTNSASASAEDNEVSVSERMETVKKKPKKDLGDEEDVDIGDDVPMSAFPPVEIQKDQQGGVAVDHGHGAATSSSSSGSTSSSGDSDSGSSSGRSDSDADDAQSRGIGN